MKNATELTKNLHALLIGVDCYMPNELPGGYYYKSLGGCVRDINHMEEFLINKLGMTKESILKLTATITGKDQPPEPRDQWPTYENMVSGFQKVTDMSQPGDMVYIHYSGHGGRATTVFPGLKGDKGLDEALVPLFTSYVLEGLNGAAAMFDKSIITASELMIYVRNRVAPNRNSKQTPAFSTLDTEPGCDFVFALPPRKKPAADLSRWVRILDQGPHGVTVSHAVVTAMEASLRQQEPLPPTSIIIPSVMKSPLTGELTFKPALSSRFQNKCLPDIANIYVSTFIGGNSLIETRMEVCSAIIMISYFILYTISASPCLI